MSGEQKVDHAAEAARSLVAADQHGSVNYVQMTGEEKGDVLLSGLVHATLALVEQQRIANLLALAGFQAETPGGGSIGTTFDAILTIRTAVAEMLGVSESGHVS